MVPTSILTVAMAVAATTLSVVAAPINGDTSSAFSTGAFNKVTVGQVPSVPGSLPRPFNLTTSEADSIRKRAGHTSTSSRLGRRKLTTPKISSGDVATGITAGSTSSSNTDSRKQRDVNEAAQQIRSLLAIAKYVNSVQRRDESVADNSDFSLSGLEPILKGAGDFNLSSIFRRDDDGTVADNSDISLSGLKPIIKDAGRW
ncbi:hypothetical protein SERLA73DRAFT_71814 [Serpula lacrymans var. lacrymans S7.3]|uniref:Uncharacterized protein n=1 Tax=Serpula lacrymans var. lacrymans (strain S7.3) TaxID=936435 RepID=F8PSY8_SERL3|nr:hypothetical protein SERLA73DRAFT_71814 [Serpula lacrymans var. lacrymans S7.3]